jgi:SAM-dependent methyltransferase
MTTLEQSLIQKPATESSQKKLHIGCFDRVYPGWINTDITPHIFISQFPILPLILLKVNRMSSMRYEQHRMGIFRQVKYLDVTKKFPWPDNTFSYIYTAHMLEHLYRDDALKCLSEVYRVLKPSGIFRIVVPDLDQLIQEYNQHSPEQFLSTFFEATQRGEAKNQHHWHYNESLLRKTLEQVGFCRTERCSFQKSEIPEIEKIEDRPDSLFLETSKM